MKRISKYLLWLFVAILILLLGVYLFVQTETFNKWVLGYTIDKLNASWETKGSRVNAESITGNILYGIKLTNGSIMIKNDSLVSFSTLEVKYDLWSLLKHKISVDFVELNTPRIYLSGKKDKEGNLVWNFAELFNLSKREDSTQASPFDWDVSVNTLKINNGNLRIAGDYSDTIPLWQVKREKEKNYDFYKSDITDIWLDMDLNYLSENKNINIRNLSFNTNSDFVLKKLTLDANVNVKDNYTDIPSLQVVTGRSDVKIEKLHVANVNPLTGFNYEEFGNKDIGMILTANRINFADLEYFLPDVNMLDSAVALYLDVSGKYNDLTINDLNLKLPNSDINLKGKVKKLTNPDSMYLDITGRDLKIYLADVKTVCNIKEIPDYSNMGTLEGNIYYRGTTSNFYSEYDLRTNAGYVNGNTSLDINNEIYSGNITSTGLDLAKITKDNRLKSNLNFTARFDGIGFNPNTVSAHVIYSLNRSTIAGYSMSSAGEVHDVHNKLEVKVNVKSNAGDATVNGKVNIADLKNPVYAVKGNVSRLDISGFTKNESDKSSINAAFDINGRGTNPDNINGRFDFVVDNSSYSDYRIPKTPLNINIINNGSRSSLNIVTAMAEINAAGSFNFGAISDALRYNIRSLSNAIRMKMNPDSVSNNPDGISPVTKGGTADLKYELVTKDTSKLSALLRPIGVLFNGGINGSIKNGPNGFFSTASLDIKDFRYKDTVVILRNVKSDLSVNNDYTNVGTEGSFAPFNIIAGLTAQKINFADNKIDSADLQFDLTNSIADLNVRAALDSTSKGNLSGRFDLTGQMIAGVIDTLSVKYNKFQLSNNNNLLVNYLPGRELEFRQFSIKSKNVIANISGKYSFDNASDLTLESNNLKIKDLYTVLYSRDSTVTTGTYRFPFDGEFTTLSVNYRGTTEDPELYTVIKTGSLKYNKNNIGSIAAKLQYKDEVLTPDIIMSSYNNQGNLTLSGNMPYKNPFVRNGSSVEFINNPVSLKLAANNFQVQYFAKLLPSLGDIEGILKGEITANGTVASPDLLGGMALTKGGIFFPLTGMYYGFNFNVSTANSMLLVDRFSLFNPDDDSRHFDLGGNVDFTGLKINNIDLAASGDMVFLDKSVDENELGIYGTLYAGSGTPPIKIKGNFDKLDITGQILIKDATISSVPLNGTGYDLSEDNFEYVNASDTSFHQHDSLIAIGPRRYKKINPFDKYKYRLTRTESSVMDFLNINLNVKTERNIYASIDFNNVTRDRLYGEIQADLNLKTENKVVNAYGNVDVVGNSYYRFYRDFKVNESRVTFNGPISNPILDIKAVYGGTRVIQQFGTTANTPVQVQLTIKGELDNPEIVLSLLENGTAVGGSDAQGDAVTFLLFGVYKSDLSSSQTTAMASSVGTSVGSLYATSYISAALREILPFIVDAEFQYNVGDVVQNTNVSVTSEFGDATVRLGDRGINNVNYFEFMVDYPMNKLLNLNLPETLLLELSKENLTNSVITNTDVHYSTGLKVIYKFKF